MKKKFYLLTLLLILFAAPLLQAQNLDNAGEYMNAIGNQRESISKKFMSYVSAAAHGKRARKVENLRSKLLNEVQEAKMNISALPSFKGDGSYRDTTVNFLKLYYNILNEDYSKIINLEDIAEQSYDDMEAYMMAQDMVDKKLEEGNEKLRLATEKFAAANNIKLVDSKSELSKMTDEVHAINKYYHEVYLLFFKPYKQEEYMLEAMGKGNITGIEQNKSSLLRYAQDGLAKLATMKSFEGDNAVVFACKAMLNFYAREVNLHMNAITDYFLAKERFAGIEKEFKKKNKPSKEEVDAYNKAVNDINNASHAYNETNNDLNHERSELLSTWNKSVNDFFDEHTPHYK